MVYPWFKLGSVPLKALALASVLGCTLNRDDETVSFCLLNLLSPGLPILYTFSIHPQRSFFSNWY